MLYMAHMIVTPPMHDTAAFEDAKLREKTYSQELQKSGKWQHLWRVVGEYANYSVFDVASNDELHELLAKLPLFPYMQIKVTPLAAHPSAITK